ncbi:MAG: 4Fe-4S binding protein [Clostridia bacterium]|nr:4Fe-4S binding protein [Clostridia bacterium]
MKNALLKYLPTRRRIVQLYAAILYNAHVKGFVKGTIYVGKSKSLCVPGLNCYSCPGAVGSCPLGALQNAVSSAKTRTPFYVLGIVMLMGLILGRTICGWLCPVGFIQELVHKIPVPKIGKSRVTRLLSWLKYVILIVFVLILPLWNALKGFPLPAFCKYICPAGTLEGALGLLSHPSNAGMKSMLGGLFTWKMIVLILIACVCVFVYRAFCRFLCPLGAVYGLFAKLAFIGVKVDMPSCVDCGKCISHCGMDIRQVGDHECIHCGECIGLCPTGAISFKAGKITLMENEAGASFQKRKGRGKAVRIIGTAAIIILAALLWYFNR